MATRSKDTSVNGWEGWIHKQGSLVPSWKKRYLVLNGQEISYYDKDVKDRRAKIKGNFTLAGVQSNKDINNGMTLHGTDGKMMNIYTKTVGEFVMCKNAMENAISAKTDRFKAESQPTPVDYRSTSVRTDRSSEAVSERASDLRSPPQNTRSPYQPNQYSLRSQASGEYQQRQYLHPKPTYSGWLEKEGDLVKSWKRRYFVLHGLDIAYYDNVEGSQKGGGRIYDIQVNDNGLQFHLDNNRILKVIAENQDDLQGWYSAVNQSLGRPVVDIRRKHSSSNQYGQAYTGAGAQFRRQSSSNQYGGNGYNVSSSPPYQTKDPVIERKSTTHSPAAVTSATPLPDPKLQSYLDKYMPAAPVIEPEPAYETGVSDISEQAVASTTPSIVADFSTEFELNDLASPEASLMTDEQQKGQGLWLQRGGSTYVPDESAIPTVFPSRSHIATDITPRPAVKLPIVRTTSSDDLKNKLWIAPSTTVAAMAADLSSVSKGTSAIVKEVSREVTKEVAIANVADDTTAQNGTGPVTKEVTIANVADDTTAQNGTAPVTSSGLWIQQGGSTYVPDVTKVPTVLPTRSHIATDIPPPIAKAPYVRTTSSDDLKKKLWVAPSGIPTGTEEKVVQSVVQSVVQTVEVPTTQELNIGDTTASGLWIQKGGSTYVPDETKVPTVFPTRSHIATEVPPPLIKEPIVRTTSSDDLKKKLWVAPTSNVLTKKTSVRGMGSASAAPVVPVINPSVAPDISVTLEKGVAAEVKSHPITVPTDSPSTPIATKVIEEPLNEVYEEKVIGLMKSPTHADTKSPVNKSPVKHKKTKQVEGAAPKGCCTLM